MKDLLLGAIGGKKREQRWDKMVFYNSFFKAFDLNQGTKDGAIIIQGDFWWDLPNTYDRLKGIFKGFVRFRIKFSWALVACLIAFCCFMSSEVSVPTITCWPTLLSYLISLSGPTTRPQATPSESSYWSVWFWSCLQSESYSSSSCSRWGRPDVDVRDSLALWLMPLCYYLRAMRAAAYCYYCLASFYGVS